MTNVDWKKTKERIILDGRTPTSFARLCGYVVPTVLMMFQGRYPDSALKDAVIEDLRRMGYLVMVGEDEGEAPESHMVA